MKNLTEKQNQELAEWCKAFGEALLKEMNRHVETVASIRVDWNAEAKEVEVTVVPVDEYYANCFLVGPIFGRIK